MIDAEKSIEIALPAKQVWDFLADFSRWPSWMDVDPKLEIDMKVQDSGQIGFGAGRKVSYSDSAGVKREYEVKEWAPPQALTLESVAPGASLYKFTLAEKAPGKTTVSLRLEIHLPGGQFASMLGILLGFAKSVDITAEEVLKQLDAAARAAA